MWSVSFNNNKGEMRRGGEKKYEKKMTTRIHCNSNVLDTQCMCLSVKQRGFGIFRCTRVCCDDGYGRRTSAADTRGDAKSRSQHARRRHWECVPS